MGKIHAALNEIIFLLMSIEQFFEELVDLSIGFRSTLHVCKALYGFTTLCIDVHFHKDSKLYIVESATLSCLKMAHAHLLFIPTKQLVLQNLFFFSGEKNRSFNMHLIFANNSAPNGTVLI